jgi:hypothetical protein
MKVYYQDIQLLSTRRNLMSHSESIIEPYSHPHDAGLAEMWNASDQQWPGGFTRGVPFTAERKANWMDKQTTLVRLVAITPDGAIVGYGSLWDEPSQLGRSAYNDFFAPGCRQRGGEMWLSNHAGTAAYTAGT